MSKGAAEEEQMVLEGQVRVAGKSPGPHEGTLSRRVGWLWNEDIAVGEPRP